MQDRTYNRKMKIVSYFWLSRGLVPLVRGPSSMNDDSLAIFIRDNEGKSGIVRNKRRIVIKKTYRKKSFHGSYRGKISKLRRRSILSPH